jgi:hypothetical protein
VGSYAIDGSGLSAQNYVFVQAQTNADALTIDPATLTYVADAVSRTYGEDNPAFTGTVTGFVNGVYGVLYETYDAKVDARGDAITPFATMFAEIERSQRS